mmetsp:Transcript_48665/g.96040  ORF Transcript_48665/g.96040 Transcript_48665/m.96040 type:complete len:150 (+) Transcript_48665:864-1313(+)
MSTEQLSPAGGYTGLYSKQILIDRIEKRNFEKRSEKDPLLWLHDGRIFFHFFILVFLTHRPEKQDFHTPPSISLLSFQPFLHQRNSRSMLRHNERTDRKNDRKPNRADRTVDLTGAHIEGPTKHTTWRSKKKRSTNTQTRACRPAKTFK